MIDRLDLDAIEARVNATPDGPWDIESHDDQYYGRFYAVTSKDGNVVVPVDWNAELFPDVTDDVGELIANARADVPALVARVRSLEAVLRDFLAPAPASLGSMYAIAEWQADQYAKVRARARKLVGA